MKYTSAVRVFLPLCLLLVAVAGRRPNIVIILADDLGWDDVSFHGSDQIPTPNIDDLANRGIMFSNYYVSPICTPTRSALMSGRHPIHTGMQHEVIGGATPYGLPLNLKIMPQYLKDLGYKTHIVGKWHLGFYVNESTPTFRGFDSHFGYYTGHEDYFDHTSQDSGYWGLDLRSNMNLLKNEYGNYATNLFSNEGERIIRSHNQESPLFLYLAHLATHAGNFNGDPVQAPEKYVKKFTYIKDTSRRIFAGMVAALDESVGNISRALVETGQMDNTILLFSTDNGGPTNGYDRNAACNWPLRGVKNTMWEGGVRGIGFVYSPLLQKTNYISDKFIHVSDWLPTLYSAAGGDPKNITDIDGVDVWSMLSHDTAGVRTEILHNIDPIEKFSAIRVGEYKLIQGVQFYDNSWYPPPGMSLSNSIETDDTLRFYGPEQPNTGLTNKVISNSICEAMSLRQNKIVVDCGPKPANASTNCNSLLAPCLFHIPTDPCEYKNIADQFPDIVNKLIDRIDAYNRTAVPPGNKPNDPRANPDLHGGAWVPWLKLSDLNEL